MAYVAPIHRASSIRNALCIRLLPDEDSLVVAKANRLEIWRVTPKGMSMEHSAIMYGTITMLQRLRPKDSDTDLLFVGTNRFEYFTAEWNPTSQRLETIDAFPDVAEEHMRESQSQNKCLVDPSGRFMAMLLWEGVVNVMRLLPRKPATKKLEWLEQVRITELFIKGATFLPTETGQPKIAFLYQTQSNTENARLSVYRLTSDDRHTTSSKFDPERDRELDMEIPDKFARILIPVSIVEAENKRYHHRHADTSKVQLGGVIVVGETLLVYIDSLTKATVKTALSEPRIFVAWAEYDVCNYFLADDYGTLHLLTIRTDGVLVTGLTVLPVGSISRASVLAYMGNDMLFVGSHHGDSQLVRFDGNSQKIVLIQTLASIAPILDFDIMDMGNREGDTQLGNEFSSGQARIVAGCGAFRSGSLRSIRSAVHLEDVGILGDFSNIRGLFTLRPPGSQKHDALIISFLTDTRVFTFATDGGIEEVSTYQGLILDQPTLLVRNLPGDKLLHITPTTVNLLDAGSGVRVSTWQPQNGATITNASANDRWALISIDGTTLVSLNLAQDLAAKQQATGQRNQIACVHAAPYHQDVGVIGFWETGSISIINLKTLEALHGEDLRQTKDSASTPREIVLAQLHPPSAAGPTLLVAMEDGNIVNFDVSVDDYSLSGRKTVILGRKHAHLNILSREGGTCDIFATTEQSSLIYNDHGRIIYSAALADDATYVAPFDSEIYPDTVFIATESQVRISHIDNERRAHVRPLDMGETVRRIAYSPKLGVFGLGCIKKDLVGNEEVITSTFKLAEEISFERVGKPFMLDTSTSVEVVETVLRAELPDSNGNLAERFLIGTSFAADSEMAHADVSGGRILVLGVDSDQNPYRIHSRNLQGACRVLRVMGGKIVAALSKSVIVYGYSEDSTTSATMHILAKYLPKSFPVDIDVVGDIVSVTDLMQSTALVEYVPPKDGKKAKLMERAYFIHNSWGTAICHLEEQLWLLADAEGNLMVLRRNSEGPTEEDRMQMQMTSDFNLGEQVNAIRRVQVAPGENAIVVPKAFIATVEGSLYVYAHIASNYMDLLMTFQSRLSEVIKPECLGNLTHTRWRGYRTAKRAEDAPFRFLDGEMLERFLDLDEMRQEIVCEGLGPSVENMRDIVEELKRMH